MLFRYLIGFLGLVALLTAVTVRAEPLFPNAEVKLLYMTNCAECHGRRGRGGADGPSLKQNDLIIKMDDETIFKTISAGVPKKAKRHPASEFAEAMQGFAKSLSKEEIELLKNLMRQWNG